MRFLRRISAQFGTGASSLRWLAYAGCVAVSAAIAWSNLGQPFDEQMRVYRDGIRNHAATGQIHVVEIDAASIAQMNTWPWPRHLHGDLVDRLREARVPTVAFDVDFSAPSKPKEDAAFAAALARFGGSAILPTFRQIAGGGDAKFLENLPIEPLKAHAFLGSVNVHPDPDGEMRSYSYGTITQGTPRPSVAALLAGVAGKMEQSFTIDQSIDPATIPRHSFGDVVNGKIGAKELAGKTVLVGATAIELGDRYAVPRHGVLPGVVIQALAAETLLQGSANPTFGVWPLLGLAILISLWLIQSRSRRNRMMGASASIILFNVAPLVLESLHLGTLEIAPALSLIFAIWGLATLLEFARSMNKARFFDLKTGLPNERALLRDLRTAPSPTILAVRIKDHTELSAVLSAEQMQQLTNRITDRIALAYGSKDLYLLQSGMFAVSLAGQKPEDIIEQMEATAAVFRSPINLDTRQIVVSVACGVAHSPTATVEQVCANARLAADEAAALGHSWHIHNEARLGEADRSLQLLADIDDALLEHHIHVVFQPKLDIKNQRISGAEALVRWRHPSLGPISPDQFIPLLEAHGRMAELTHHVLDASIAEMRKWHSAGFPIGVAVNISAPLLNDGPFMDETVEKLSKLGGFAGNLTLEITESATLADAESAREAVKRFKALNVRISIDDYGTGQSTLTYLKALNASEIKIDKSFITNMVSSRSDQILVRSTIELAHELGFKVVAEGIEDAECMAQLVAYGCDTGQGWHIGKPISSADLLTLLLEKQAVVSVQARKAA
jgi:diguanylate cyclase